MGTDALSEVREYVALQKVLIASLLRRDDASRYAEMNLSGLARTGEVVVDAESWTYKLHGAGVRFQHGATGRQVDIHRSPDRPELFDSWRLRTYFGSLGRRGVKMVEREIGSKGQSLDKAIDLLLERWLEAGIVTEDEGSYRLT